VRDRRAGFKQSLRVLEEAKLGAKAAGKEILTKTSIMLGVGERGDEVEEALRRESRRSTVG
jgi:lipoic acid synthetase